MRYICLQVLGHGGLRLALSSLLLQALCCAEDGFWFIFLLKWEYLIGKREKYIWGCAFVARHHCWTSPAWGKLCEDIGQDLVPTI